MLRLACGIMTNETLPCVTEAMRDARAATMMSQPEQARRADWRFCVAPMMDWTDRYCRAFHRVLSRRARLYTEMVTANAVVHGSRERILGFDAREKPLALQLGGSDPALLAQATRIAEDFGYDEVNLNVGCPSERVRDGMFGACLMHHPALVADCVAAMRASVRIPVTVKCRIGVDDQEPSEALPAMAQAVAATGAAALIVHARKAWLQGLSPRENRDVPPLDYPLVRSLAVAMPNLPIVLNGGLSLETAQVEASFFDGVMLGRAAYKTPALLLDVDRLFFDDATPARTPREALEAFTPFIEERLAAGVPLAVITRHVLGLFTGVPGARAFRRRLTIDACRPDAGISVVLAALTEMDALPRALAA